MKAFAELYRALDETTKTNEKIAALHAYFSKANPGDAAWAIYFLTGRKPRQLVQAPKLAQWAIEESEIPGWLFDESYDAVGDFAETIALLLPDTVTHSDARSLTYWIEEQLLPLRGAPDAMQRETVLHAWRSLDERQSFIWNKLLTGAFRVGVSQQLVIRAVSKVSGLDTAVVAHRLMGNWEPSRQFYLDLISQETSDADISRPYPFFLAYPLEADPPALGEVGDWQAEWKWDGIRAQLIKRDGRVFIWSRGEDLITDRFPELETDGLLLPDGSVLDGEILPWKEANVLPFAQLQQRIGRKNLTKKMMEEVPVVLMAYDLLEFAYEDLRQQPLSVRRLLLEKLLRGELTIAQQSLSKTGAPQAARPTAEKQLLKRLRGELTRLLACSDDPVQLKLDFGPEFQVPPLPSCAAVSTRLRTSPVLSAQSWQELTAQQADARTLDVEGIMLKRRHSPYRVGRQRGDWWKWKVNPYTIDAVLIYAQRGTGKRASLYTDYTFGLWDKDGLVPVAKAYSGLTDEEIRQVDRFVRENTLDKYGPVRVVKPQLVFELAFEGIQRSSRHRSGIAVRFPRMARWRKDKPVHEADTLQNLEAMIITRGITHQ